jgi:hypothetical protein
MKSVTAMIAAAMLAAPAVADEAKQIKPADLAVAPAKYIGKPIQIGGMQCFYANVDEYRCFAPSIPAVTVFSETIEPADMKRMLEEKCGEFDKATSKACRFTIRFTPQTHGRDVVSLGIQRTVVGAQAVEILPAKKR